MSSAIYPIIGATEISLRNAVDRALRAHLGNFWWSGAKLRYRSFAPGVSPPQPVKAVRDNFVKATRKFVAEQRSRYGVTGAVAPNHHGVMAKTEFSTWGFMLDQEFMGNSLIWPSRLGTVFAGAWPSSHAASTLSYAHDLVSTVRDFRNRLFHHEPAWKRFGVRSEADALIHLQEKIGKIESLLALIHPENLRLFEKNGFLNIARRACTSHEIRRFQHLTQTYKVNSLGKLQSLVARGGLDNSVIRAKLYSGQQRQFLVTPV